MLPPSQREWLPGFADVGHAGILVGDPVHNGKAGIVRSGELLLQFSIRVLAFRSTKFKAAAVVLFVLLNDLESVTTLFACLNLEQSPGMMVILLDLSDAQKEFV